MNNSLKKLLGFLCSSCLALSLYVVPTRISILFFGEPEYPFED